MKAYICIITQSVMGQQAVMPRVIFSGSLVQWMTSATSGVGPCVIYVRCLTQRLWLNIDCLSNLVISMCMYLHLVHVIWTTRSVYIVYVGTTLIYMLHCHALLSVAISYPKQPGLSSACFTVIMGTMSPYHHCVSHTIPALTQPHARHTPSFSGSV